MITSLLWLKEIGENTVKMVLRFVFIKRYRVRLFYWKAILVINFGKQQLRIWHSCRVLANPFITQ